MGDLNEFSLKLRLFLKAYPWRRIDPVPWAAPARPLSQSRVALVSSAAFVMPGQEPFDESVKGGDFSFREIPADADPSRLSESHRSEAFDHAGIRADPNLAFPIERLRECEGEGRIGSLSPRHYSIMGSITAPGRLMRDTAPEIARRMAADAVDVALLVPV